MQSRAAVFHGSGHPLEVELFSMPAAGEHEFIVEVLCCTLCGSDLHTIRGERGVAGPTILGHEVVGRVVQLPSAETRDHAGQGLAAGDRVTWSIAASCGSCFYCRTGLTQKCVTLFKYGHEVITESGSPSGGLAEYCRLVPGTAVFKIPDNLSDSVACPANCATATVAAALRAAGGCHGKSVIIHGAGALGLTAAAMVRHQRPASVLVTDLAADRLELASRFGATDAILAGDTPSIERAISRSTGGRGADLVFELSGSPDAIEASIDQLRIGGRLMLVGSVFPSRPIQLDPERIVRRLLRVEGVHNYTAADLAAALAFLEETCGDYPFEDLVGEEFALGDVNQAVATALAGHTPRVAVRPSIRGLA